MLTDGSAMVRVGSNLIPAALVLGATFLAGALIFALQPHNKGVREWSPDDHDHPQMGPASTAVGRPTMAQGDAVLIESTWTRSCAQCHGPEGRGDGPQGAMVGAADLTRAEWQERVTDDAMAQVIRAGRNKMPSFNLPPAVVAGIVKRIRANRGANR